MKKKLTSLQLVTLILGVCYLVWEKNMQDYLAVNGLSNTTDTRVDLFVIVPILGVLIGIAVLQYFKKPQ